MAETAKTAVFWDMEDCQIPDGLDAVVVSQTIRSALKKMSYGGTVSIYAYGETNQIEAGLEEARFVVKRHELPEKAHKEYLGTASICDRDDLESPLIVINHTPSGDKHSRLEKIIIDSFSWALDNAVPANVMFILGDISSYREFISVFYHFDAAKYGVLLAEPGIASRPYPVRTKWLWESLSAGGDPVDDDQSESDDDQSESNDGQFESDIDDDQIEIKSSRRVIPKRYYAAGIIVCALIDLTRIRFPRYIFTAGSLFCTVAAFFLGH